MASVRELLTANLEVFGERDATRRRATIERTYADSVVFRDPEDTVTGWDALDAKAGGLLADAPADFVLEEDGLAYTDADTGVLGWTFGPAGSPVARGVDIITVTDGRISALHTILV